VGFRKKNWTSFDSAGTKDQKFAAQITALFSKDLVVQIVCLFW